MLHVIDYKSWHRSCQYNHVSLVQTTILKLLRQLFPIVTAMIRLVIFFVFHQHKRKHSDDDDVDGNAKRDKLEGEGKENKGKIKGRRIAFKHLLEEMYSTKSGSFHLSMCQHIKETVLLCWKTCQLKELWL